MEAATGHTLGQELDRRILRPLGLRDTFFPVNAPGLPSPKARGYSVPVSPQGQLLAGPLLDFTIYNPSFAWAAGALISTFADLARFFRALLGGRLLPPRLLAEMATPNPTSPPPSVRPWAWRYWSCPPGAWWATLVMFSALAMPSSAPRTATGSLT